MLEEGIYSRTLQKSLQSIEVNTREFVIFNKNSKKLGSFGVKIATDTRHETGC
jgi:hypothetical protein